MKSTFCEVEGRGIDIFKRPKTDQGKNSHRGLLFVGLSPEGQYVVEQQVTRERMESPENQLREIWRDGKLLVRETLQDIRARVDREVERALQA